MSTEPNDIADRNNPPKQAAPMHAPWREAWIRDIAKRERDANQENKERRERAHTPATPASSFLREYWLQPDLDAQNHVIVRTKDNEQTAGGMVLLNAYPYTGGHLLVALGDGRPRLTDYTEAQRSAFWSLVDLATLLCERTLEPQGVNIGLNVGRAAGAGVPTHLHAHVIPRWQGDTNFLAAVSNVRLVNASLERFAEAYREEWATIRDAID